MSEKDEIRNRIDNSNVKLDGYRKELRELEEKYELLIEFIGKCSSRADSFNDSVKRRRDKNKKLPQKEHIARSILSYCKKMHSLLHGDEYNKAVENINSVMESADREKQNTINEINELQRRINQLESQIDALNIEYNSIKDEEV